MLETSAILSAFAGAVILFILPQSIALTVEPLLPRKKRQWLQRRPETGCSKGPPGGASGRGFVQPKKWRRQRRGSDRGSREP